MLSRRALIAGGLAAAALPIAGPAFAKKKKKKPFKVAEKFKPQVVPFDGYDVGTLVVDTKSHFLYLVESPGVARRYGVGVGAAGRSLRGEAFVERKAKWPSWRPTKNMIRRNPRKYRRYAKGVPGGPRNPLGARALYLYRGGRDTYYRIHGTTEPSSIGRSVSNGCIRMINAHVKDLYERVPMGTRVIIL